MNEVTLDDLSVDSRRNIRNLFHEARICLRTIKHFSEVVLGEIDNNGNHASLSPVKKEMGSQLTRLMYLTGEIEALRHITASMETVSKFSNTSSPAACAKMAIPN